MKPILIIGTLPSSLLNFRGELLTALVNKSYPTIGMADNTHDISEKLQAIGITFRSYPVERCGLNPFRDIRTLYTLCNAFKTLQPEAVLAYTIKPVIWGAFASYTIPKTRFYALITGLGFAFQGKTFKRRLLIKLVTSLYRIALKRAERIIFQNPDNLNEFVQRGIVSYEKCVLVNGSGVNIDHYVNSPFPNKPITFLTIGRLLGEKGFREYFQAAQIVKTRYPNTIFQLLGPEDPSPDGIPLTEVQAWHDQGILYYLGSTNDVRPYLQGCHIFVLPSYHEGMPRTVLEAMATGRPILTTDVPGCRETILNGENGYLVPKADVQALVERMIWFIENPEKWENMGIRSREIAEEKYDVHKVNKKLMEIMNL